MLKLLLVAISFLLVSVVVKADVYVWRDAKGLLTYSDLLPPEGARDVKILRIPGQKGIAGATQRSETRQQGPATAGGARTNTGSRNSPASQTTTAGGGAPSAGGSAGAVGGGGSASGGGATAGSGSGELAGGGSAASGGGTTTSGGTPTSSSTTTAGGGTSTTGGTTTAGGSTSPSSGTTAASVGGTSTSSGTTTAGGGASTSSGTTATTGGGTSTSGGTTAATGGGTSSSGGTTAASSGSGTPLQGLWSAGMEVGTMSEWYADGGGGEFNGHPGNFAGSVGNDGSTTGATREQAHSGTWSAKLSIPSNGATRLVRQYETRQHAELYYSAWYYVPRSYTLSGPGAFWMLMQWKSSVPAEGKHDPFFMFVAYSATPSTLNLGLAWFPLPVDGPLPGQTGYRLFPSNIPVPVGRWFKVETRYKSAGDFTGAIQMWIDGVEVWHMENVRTRYWNGDTIWSITSYAQGLGPTPAVIYVDDVVISKR